MNNIQALADKMRRMHDNELFNALYRDYLTGVLNRRAFEEIVSPRETVAIVDLDSLKWLNDNHGHRAGDKQIKRLALVLQRYTDIQSVYRLSGDEFAVIGPALPAAMVKAQALFPGMSYGIGRGLEQADQQLRISKTEREASGKRAPRGERPPWAQETTT